MTKIKFYHFMMKIFSLNNTPFRNLDKLIPVFHQQYSSLIIIGLLQFPKFPKTIKFYTEQTFTLKEYYSTQLFWKTITKYYEKFNSDILF